MTFQSLTILLERMKMQTAVAVVLFSVEAVEIVHLRRKNRDWRGEVIYILPRLLYPLRFLIRRKYGTEDL